MISKKAAEAQTARALAKAEETRAAKDLRAQEAMAEWAKWMCIVTGIQAFIGLASLLGLAFTVVFAKSSADDSGRSADAASQALEHTVETSKRQLRAYVSVQQSSCEVYGGADPEVRVIFRNSGQTPARFRSAGVLVFHPVNQVVMPQVSYAAEPYREIGAGGDVTMFIQLHRQITAQDYNDYVNGQQRFMLYLDYEYFDVFDDRHARGVRATVKIQSGAHILVEC
ncbi:hypothetical protein [Caulobacter sp. UNC279MFTsu5.1]|uniref:hypothetical protein n=1 Tax=Caulobacter sp. UNC279MFTsu5.1 TaxID=1502775 RepID=UPI00036E1C4D|nr:hypothetical protein [Caulobacter sp. UNC279MFTsu5.1]